MSRNGRVRGGGLLFALAFGVAVTGPFACSSPAQLSASGGACTSINDCQAGLACCDGPKGSFTCTSDFSCIQPAGMGGGMDAGAAATGTDATASDAAMTMPGPDATQHDATQQQDASPPEKDVTVPPPDTGTPPPPPDTGAPEDTGTHQEAAPPPGDAAGDDATGD